MLRLVLAGDVNMNRTQQAVRPDGIYLWGEVLPFADLFTHVAPLVEGDVCFCNLETTVMDRNDIPRADKKYNFRTHPLAIRALRDAGFNLLSIANNHNGGLVFYSLGNFVMRGPRNRGNPPGTGHLKDFGLLARVDVVIAQGKVTFSRIEAIPVTDMHYRTRPFPKAAETRRRLESLNALSGPKYIGRNSHGIVFEVPENRGVWLAPTPSQ